MAVSVYYRLTICHARKVPKHSYGLNFIFTANLYGMYHCFHFKMRSKHRYCAQS